MLHGLARLEIILASDNQICNLDPEGLIRTEKLATLDLRNNELMQIPPQLGNCTQLRSVPNTVTGEMFTGTEEMTSSWVTESTVFLQCELFDKAAKKYRVHLASEEGLCPKHSCFDPPPPPPG